MFTYNVWILTDNVIHCVHCKRLNNAKCCREFHIHMSVHHEYISKLQRTRCNISWFIYFYRQSTCFRLFLRPSSRAHICTYTFRYFQPILLFAAIVDEMELKVPSHPRQQQASVMGDNTWRCMYIYVLLMMGGGAA